MVAALTSACGARTGLSVPESTDASIDASLDVSVDAQDTAEGVDASDAWEVIDAGHDVFEEAPDIARLDGLRWELPCLAEVSGSVCTTKTRVQTLVALTGPSGARYRVTVRFRGVVEEKGYTGGTNDGAHWQVGGKWTSDDWNIYSLDISSPLQRYFLNRGTSGVYACIPIDYTKDIEVDSGASVLLDAISMDSQEIVNADGAGKPIVVVGVKPAPKAYNGQFIQMDVLALVRLF